MTRNTVKASANAPATHPTTKSHCPAGAGLISSSPAPEGSHTPPQACAVRAHDPAFQQASTAQAAQPAEGYKHPFLVRRMVPNTALGRQLEAKLKGIDKRLANAERQPDSRANRKTIKHLQAEFKATLTALKHECVQAQMPAFDPDAPLGIDSEGGSCD